MVIMVTSAHQAPALPRGTGRDVRMRWIMNDELWPCRQVQLGAPGFEPAHYQARQPSGRLRVLVNDGCRGLIAARLESPWRPNCECA